MATLPLEALAAVQNPAVRRQVEATIDALIELLDAADGDADEEVNGDELEDVEGDYSCSGTWLNSISWARAGASEDDEDGEFSEWEWAA